MRKSEAYFDSEFTGIGGGSGGIKGYMGAQKDGDDDLGDGETLPPPDKKP